MADLAKQQPESTPATICLKDYTPPDFLVDKVDLDFELDEESTVVHSRLRIIRNQTSLVKDAPLILDGSHQKLISIIIDGECVDKDRYHLTDSSLSITHVPDIFTLEVISENCPAENLALEGLYHSSSMLCTQCEAEGFRRITYFPDRPDVMTRFTVTLHADRNKYPVLLANGNLIEQGEDGDRHWARWDDPSLKPSYLFAIVAGQLEYIEDHYERIGGRDVILRIYVESENIYKCDHAMTSLKQAMKWDEEVYGREYDLDIFMIVAVNDFNMGAMENKGLNIFNSSCVLASPETATDADFYSIQSIIGHEYFHNWSGNRVTCRDWFQLSLKEGFTVYRDQEFSADLNSRAVKRIDDVNVLRGFQFAQDAGPMAHPVRPDQYIEISNFYTVTVYNKGAEVVRMIHNLVGADGFRKGTDLYFKRHDGQAVTTEDFVAAMEDANNTDLTQFKHWYDQAGTPELDVTDEYDADNQLYTLNIRQSCPATPGQPVKHSFHIPIATGLLDHDGNDIPLMLEGEENIPNNNTRILSVKDEKNVFTFKNVKQKPIPSLGRGFSAPIKTTIEEDNSRLAFLLAHDSDAFNRWDAGQKLALNTLLDLVTEVQKGQFLKLENDVVGAFQKILTNKQVDKALLSRILNLPSESYIADQMEIVDVEAIHTAREFMLQTLANQLFDEFLAVYKNNTMSTSYSFNANEMARRSLKNTALAYLVKSDKHEMHQLCVDQYSTANNMTDVMGALACLSDIDIPERKTLLDVFYTKWQEDQQVVEKWFALQAGSSLPDTLSHVKDLMKHDAFSITNPNKVRALIGRFCAGNPVRFHAADGSGYTFLTDQVLELDELNPQLAARLVQSLSRWKRYDVTRQELMSAELQRILDHECLSKDVYEIASKSLGA